MWIVPWTGITKREIAKVQGKLAIAVIIRRRKMSFGVGDETGCASGAFAWLGTLRGFRLLGKDTANITWVCLS